MTANTVRLSGLFPVIHREKTVIPFECAGKVHHEIELTAYHDLFEPHIRHLQHFLFQFTFRVEIAENQGACGLGELLRFQGIQVSMITLELNLA